MSESPIPSSPRYSCAHMSSVRRCTSETRTSVPITPMKSSCAKVPIGETPNFLARKTFDVPEKMRRPRSANSRTTSSCQAPE